VTLTRHPLLVPLVMKG